ncbi:MAG: hypothetical protein ACOYO0_05045 [Sandarakinorhabdus sp.]
MKPVSETKRPDFDENSPPWLKRLMLQPETKSSMSLGMFNLSIEGIIRVCLNQDASEPVEINTEVLARCLHHLSEDHVGIDLKNLALAVLAAALVAKEGSYKLTLSQERTGPPPRQSSDEAETMVRRIQIAKSAEAAAARGERSPNKVAAREHDCSEDEVKAANALVKKAKRLIEEQGA